MNTTVTAAINALAGQLKVPETFTTYLVSEFETSNIRRFLVVAYHLACVMHKDSASDTANEERFAEILFLCQKAVEEEVDLDGPNVMNLVGITSSIDESKEIIFRIAKELPKALPILEEYSGGTDTETFLRDCLGITDLQYFKDERLPKQIQAVSFA